MPISRDYSQLLTSFASNKFRTLRPAQSSILHSYATSFTSTSDVAVELPTGAGKTLIALLIAEAWRQEAKKVAILSANKTLAKQMMQEANALNIPAVLMEGRGSAILSTDKRAYQRAKSIAVMNYWVYFNQSPIIDPADLIIMDDAHLAEHCLHSLYSVEIDRLQHEDLFKTVITELQRRFPDYSVFADALADDAVPTAISELLSFLDQGEAADRLREIVDASPDLDTDTDLNFRWKRIRHQLREANIYVSPNAIWIRPYIYPLISNAHYEQAQQRIYMSATIGDPADLSRRLGVKTIQKIPVSPEHMEKTSGRHMIVIEKMEENVLSERMTNLLSAALQIHPKSVWLCSSKAEASALQINVSEWLNSNGFVGHPTWLLTPLGEEIDEFKEATQGHLFVAGRFDGMDFRADECRVIIVTKLPRAINSQEEFISAYLRDAGFMKRRLNQRIVQALGRCNRSEEDFGLYILADERFSNHFSSEANREGIPRNVIAEIDMAQDAAERDVKGVVEDIRYFLRGDFNQHDRDKEVYLMDVPERSVLHGIPDTSTNEVLGWTALFANQNYEIAANRFEECWEAIRETSLMELGAFHGWNWAKALYLQVRRGEPSAHEKSIRVLEDAIRRGGQSAWFNRMRTSLNRARRSQASIEEIIQYDYADALLRAFDDRLEQLGPKGDKFEQWCRTTSERLASDRHTQYQEGLERLGQLLGYYAVRPKYNAATDCLWRGVFGNSKEIVTFEAKIEHSPSQQIVASEIGQAHNQYTRAEREYPGYAVRGTIVTHLTSITSDAEASAGNIKDLEKEAILALWNNVKILLSQYRDGWSVDDIGARHVSAQAIRARLPKTGWLIRALDTDKRFINADILCAEWA